MPVAHVEQRAGYIHRQIDRGAFDNLVEIHVPAPTSGVAGARRSLRGAGRNANASEHGTQRNRVMCEMFGRLGGRCGSIGQIEMPANRFAAIFHFGGQVAVQATTDDCIVAVGKITIQAQVYEMHRERISGHGGVDVERSSLRIAAEHANLALIVYTAGIYG